MMTEAISELIKKNLSGEVGDALRSELLELAELRALKGVLKHDLKEVRTERDSLYKELQQLSKELERSKNRALELHEDNLRYESTIRDFNVREADARANAALQTLEAVTALATTALSNPRPTTLSQQRPIRDTRNAK